MFTTHFPIRYVDPVYRPPSEADSLILPLTDGCSWNQCTFCEMYTDPAKKFHAREEVETLESIRRCGEHFGDSVRRVFLADGPAMASMREEPVFIACPLVKYWRARDDSNVRPLPSEGSTLSS